MIGQLAIKKARSYSKRALGENFSLRDFHYQACIFSLSLELSLKGFSKEKEKRGKDIKKACSVN